MAINGQQIANIATKAFGAGALALVAYDCHTAAKIHAHAYEKNHKAEGITERFLEDQKMESPSIVRQQAKEGIFKFFLDENFSDFFVSIAGYAKGFSSMLVSNVIPFALAAGTLMGKKGTKQIFSKFCGAGLLAYGGVFLAQEVLGIGKSK